MRFKKWSITLVCCLVCLFNFAAMGLEDKETFTSGDYKYVLLDDGTAEITRYMGEATELTVPKELDGYAVVGIAFRAFEGRDSLSMVTIPDTVTHIEANPFGGCDHLCTIRVSAKHPTLATIDGVLFHKQEKKLICYPCAFTDDSYVIPQGIVIIGQRAFYKSRLSTIEIPDSVTTIENMALSSINALTSITIPGSVTSLGEWALSYCEHLKDVTIQNGVTSIEAAAFSNCSSLKSITIPDSVTTIGDGAFENCYSLISIMIPDSVTNIGANPFMFCKNLKEIIIPANHPALTVEDGVLFHKTEKRLIYYPMTLTEKTYAIPQGVESIGKWAFYWCQELNEVVIPDSVTNIGDGAFRQCDQLIHISIPDSVTILDKEAFCCCQSLTSIEIPDSVTAIGERAFGYCEKLESVNMPQEIKEIGKETFTGCKSLTSITILEGVVSIGVSAFRECTMLTSLTIPGSVTSIGARAFEKCENLMLTVDPGSYAEQYAEENNILYTYPSGDTSWLIA